MRGRPVGHLVVCHHRQNIQPVINTAIPPSPTRRESGSAFVKLLLWTLSPLEDLRERQETLAGYGGWVVVFEKRVVTLWLLTLLLVSFFLFRLWLLGTCILCIISL